jgi:hypothetical protein
MDTDHACDFPVWAKEALTLYLFWRGSCMIRRVIVFRDIFPELRRTAPPLFWQGKQL